MFLRPSFKKLILIKIITIQLIYKNYSLGGTKKSQFERQYLYTLIWQLYKKEYLTHKNKINEERINNPNSKKIKYYENMLDIYKNIDTPIDYEQYGLKSSINKLNRENNCMITSTYRFYINLE